MSTFLSEAEEVVGDFIPDEPNNLSGLTQPNAFVYKRADGKICILFNSSYKGSNYQGWLGLNTDGMIGDVAPFYES